MEKEKISIKYIKAKCKLIKSKLSEYKLYIKERCKLIKQKLTGYKQSIKESAEYYRSHFTLITASILLFLSLFAFTSFWVEPINKYWVDEFASELKGDKTTFAILIFIAFSTFAYYYNVFKFERKVSIKRLIIISSLSVIYLLCLSSGKWNFYSFNDSKLFSYSNVLLCPAIGEIIVFIKRRKKKKKEELSPLLNYESPISKIEEDSYERSPYLNSTAEVLKTCFYKEGSFAVGITGSWGSGKTSSVLAIKKSICKDADIVIDFYPWKSTTPNSIIKDFFSLYKSKIDLFAPKLSSLIPKYVIALLDAKGSTLSSTLGATLNSFFSCSDDDDISSQYEEISSILKETQIKTLVIIDDLDRLECCEIMEVLRLIRNSANFPFIQFVTAYDKEYLIESLKVCNIPKGEQYLEKIFNLEITLPKFEERIICEELCAFLAPQAFSEFNIDEKELRDILFLSENEEQEDFYYVIPKMLCTKRDVIRFSNSFKIVLKSFVDKDIITQIKYKDLLIIELLRYKFLDIYERLRSDPFKLLFIKSSNLCFDSSNEYLKTKYAENERKLIIDFMSTLFKYKEDPFECEEDLSIDRRSIAHVRGFGKYFSYRLNKKDILLSEMHGLILDTNNLDTLETAEQWSDTKHDGEIKEILEQCFSSINEEELPYKKVYAFTRILLSSKKEKLQKEAMQAASSHLEAFEYKTDDQFPDLLKLWEATLPCKKQSEYIKNNYNIIKTILCQNYLTDKLKREIKQEDIEMIKNFIEETSAPIQMTLLLSAFVEEKEQSNERVPSILETEVIRNIQLSYLQKHINETKLLNDDCFCLFCNCIKKIDPYKEKDTLDENAFKLMIPFIKSHINEYFIQFIRTEEIQPYLIFKISPEPYYNEIFVSNEDFQKFISNTDLNDLKNINEVRNYWKLFSNNGHKPITFDNTRTSEISVKNLSSNNFDRQINLLKELLEIKKELENITVNDYTSEEETKKWKTLDKLKSRVENIQLPIKLKTDLIEDIVNKKCEKTALHSSISG